MAMAEHLQLDNLDRGILNALLDNARTAYAELAKQFNVSPGSRRALSWAPGLISIRASWGLMSAVLSALSLKARVTIRRR
jgi:hypothetical protein